MCSTRSSQWYIAWEKHEGDTREARERRMQGVTWEMKVRMGGVKRAEAKAWTE